MSAGQLIAFVLAVASMVLAQATPQVHYELQDQLPPVGRVNKVFMWTLLPDTFTLDASSGAGSLSYAARGMPSWLSFDANSLTFFGTPGRKDTGTAYVEVQANATGNPVGVSSSFNCLVVNTPAPVLSASLIKQLNDGEAVISSSYLESDGSIRVPPQWSFSIGFQQYVFTLPNDGEVFYTAYRAGTTSLPEWLQFDNTTVTFNGLTPYNTNNFEITLFGSDHYGYADVSQTFELVVGSHSFVLSNPLPSINVTAKEAISYPIPITGLRLDGKGVKASNLASVTPQFGNRTYLKYDNTSRTISGTFPANISSTSNIDIPIVFTDVYNDTVITNFTIKFLPQLFSDGNLPNYNVTGGKYFSQDLSRYLVNNRSIYSATFDPSNSSDWLRFDNNTNQIAGTPPSSNGQDVFVNITGRDTQAGIIESAGYTLFYTDAQTALQKGDDGGLSNGGKIAIAVVFGVLAGLLLLAAIIWLLRRHYRDDERRHTLQRPPYNEEGHSEFVSGPAYMSEKGKNKDDAPPVSPGAMTTTSEESDRLSEAMVAAAAAHAAQEENGNKPRRMDMLNLFKKSSTSNINLAGRGTNFPRVRLEPSKRSLKEVLGIVPSASKMEHQKSQYPRQHNIIVVTDGDGYTYRPESSQGSHDHMHDEPRDHGSPSEEGSSFDSHQSSSLFYTEESGPNDKSVAMPAQAHLLDTPRSIPRRRRDFEPYRPPERKASVGGAGLFPSPPRMPAGGIRIVQPSGRRGSASQHSISESDEAYSPELPQGNPNGASEVEITTAHLERLSTATTASQGTRPASRPRLIAFNSEKRATASDHGVQRFNSQRGIESDPASPDDSAFQDDSLMEAGHADDSTQDADEARLQRYSVMSTPYEPPEGGEVTAPVFFSNAEGSTSDIRLVAAAGNVSTASAGRPRRSRSGSVYSDALRIQLSVGEAFHFTAQIHPPPIATIKAPGRDGPVRSTYEAWTDYPDEPDFDGLPLPDWLHFGQQELEFWGIPRAADAGSIAVKVVERKHFSSPSSPNPAGRPSTTSNYSGRAGSADAEDKVVGRFVLDVTDKQPRGSIGDVMSITY